MSPRLAGAFVRFREALSAPGWESRPAGAEDVVVFRPPGRHGRSWCVLSFDASADAAVLHALLPLRCPAEHVTATAELCMRVNRRLAFGRLGLDPDTGDVSFQMAWPECMIDASLVPFVRVFVTLLERHVPAAIMVMQGEVAPALALASIEASAAELAWH